MNRPEVKSDQYALGVGEVADDFPDRFRQLSNQGGDSQDLIAPGQLGIDQQVNQFDLILACQVVFANLFQVGEGFQAFGRLSGDIQP